MTKQEKKVQTFKQFKHDFHNMIKKKLFRIWQLFTHKLTSKQLSEIHLKLSQKYIKFSRIKIFLENLV